MLRTDMIATVGRSFLTSNIENDEWSYPKAFAAAGLIFSPIKNAVGRAFEKLDIRFVKENVTVLIETKQIFTSADEIQLSAYVEYEKSLTGNRTIAILANTTNDEVKVWRGVVSDGDLLPKEKALRTMDEYVDFYTSKINDKEKVMQNTYKLNEMLHRHSIPEKLRSQFVGTCLLALKNGLDYATPTLTAGQIRTRIKEVLENLLNSDINKAEKLSLLNRNVLGEQYLRQLSIAAFREILTFIENNILPFINDKSTSGQDLLNLFFVTFNKYVGKSDKNQAFTPDHITDFMSKITGVNKHSVVLDPCCGSGSFLVRAMTQALDDCATASEQEHVKKQQVYGIEFDENVYGLATTNMLIHSDGNSNIRQGSCFTLADWIKEAKPNIILMNPPYNAQRIHLPSKYTDTWAWDKKEDPSKGLYFVKYIADVLNSINQQATLAVLLPIACAIGTKGVLQNIKKHLLTENTLDAVFTLPNDIFHPGATVQACCMIFKIGKKHSDISTPDTFFGYYKEDGFKKKKNIGRIEQMDPITKKSKWVDIENKWIELYRNRREMPGLSATQKVTGDDEWLCEAYMKTDYSVLTDTHFNTTINGYFSYLVSIGKLFDTEFVDDPQYVMDYFNHLLYSHTGDGFPIDTHEWREFVYSSIFDVQKGFYNKKPDHNYSGDIPFLGATERCNGVTEYYALEDIEAASKTGDDNNSDISEKIFPGKSLCVTNNGSVGCAFYQPISFTCSHDVNPLYILNGSFDMYNALFVATVIELDKYRWAYGRKWRPERMVKSTIRLPAILKDGEYIPDWEYMSDYIRNLPYRKVTKKGEQLSI